jgi:hypothetical protein
MNRKYDRRKKRSPITTDVNRFASLSALSSLAEADGRLDIRNDRSLYEVSGQEERLLGRWHRYEFRHVQKKQG